MVNEVYLTGADHEIEAVIQRVGDLSGPVFVSQEFVDARSVAVSESASPYSKFQVHFGDQKAPLSAMKSGGRIGVEMRTVDKDLIIIERRGRDDFDSSMFRLINGQLLHEDHPEFSRAGGDAEQLADIRDNQDTLAAGTDYEVSLQELLGVRLDRAKVLTRFYSDMLAGVLVAGVVDGKKVVASVLWRKENNTQITAVAELREYAEKTTVTAKFLDAKGSAAIFSRKRPFARMTTEIVNQNLDLLWTETGRSVESNPPSISAACSESYAVLVNQYEKDRSTGKLVLNLLNKDGRIDDSLTIQVIDQGFATEHWIAQASENQLYVYANFRKKEKVLGSEGLVYFRSGYKIFGVNLMCD
ncbi:hypothetical protein GCM10007053_10440 [Halioglobus pacificus]|uniref:Uncharacterized protein n=1 Tax=Parahalioglobus pacificus TaxID=930806 RepID=A0A919CJ55_9GAMM|nr:hypothetical protein GCM10007053_10440 [Halioglobus pacificus]